MPENGSSGLRSKVLMIVGKSAIRAELLKVETLRGIEDRGFIVPGNNL